MVCDALEQIQNEVDGIWFCVIERIFSSQHHLLLFIVFLFTMESLSQPDCANIRYMCGRIADRGWDHNFCYDTFLHAIWLYLECERFCFVFHKRHILISGAYNILSRVLYCVDWALQMELTRRRCGLGDRWIRKEIYWIIFLVSFFFVRYRRGSIAVYFKWLNDPPLNYLNNLIYYFNWIDISLVVCLEHSYIAFAWS